MLRTGQLLGPASHPASRPRTGALLPGTLASPRTGLTPAGCPELVDRLRHDIFLSVMAPGLLGALERVFDMTRGQGGGRGRATLAGVSTFITRFNHGGPGWRVAV